MTLSYPEKRGQNIVNLEGTNPRPSAVLNSLKQASYKNRLRGQDDVPPKATDHKVRAFGYIHSTCLSDNKEDIHFISLYTNIYQQSMDPDF